MSRRILLRFTATALVGALASGCVTQPVEETVLEFATEQLGVTPAPIVEADRVLADAEKINRLHAAKDEDADEVVWTKRMPPSDTDGGLVRDSDGTATRSGSDPDQDKQQDTSRTGRQSGDDGAARDSSDSSGDSATRDRDGGGGGATGGDGDNTDGGGSGGSGDKTDGGGGDSDSKPKPSPKPQPQPEPTPTPKYDAIASVGDREGDATGQSPAYADIRQLLVESDGKHARVTVAVAGPIPGALADGEVQGLGVDFYRSDDRESDYQLFADGDDEGWRAFLQTPDGLVEYPGSFGIGGRVFVFEVPWSALGGKKAADVDMFVDWSRRQTPVNRAGNDRAPEKGRVRVTPA